MKEGIDGEAVDWAASRLSRRSEKSKILIVLSDCAPIDDATLSVNGMTYLEIDLHRAISQAKKSGIEILAIDNHAIGRSKPQQYYDNVAYACAQDSMDPKDAALATARAVEAIVRPQPASALSP
jgi:cobaltochelatase CobT